MRVFEVFLKREGKDEFRHAGSIEAATEELALVMARESYARRAEGQLMWLVDRANIVAADDTFIAPNSDKPHRHNDGSRVAARRRSQREASQEDSAS